MSREGKLSTVSLVLVQAQRVEAKLPISITLLLQRSPSNLVRQLYDFQHGTRAGPWSPLMAPNVINLTFDDIVARGLRGIPSALNNPPQIMWSRLSNSMLGSGPTTPQDYPE